MKGNACRRVGMESMAIELPASTRTNDLLREIEQLNQNPNVHGILLQHPVPSQIDERACFDMLCICACSTSCGRCDTPILYCHDLAICQSVCHTRDSFATCVFAFLSHRS